MVRSLGGFRKLGNKEDKEQLLGAVRVLLDGRFDGVRITMETDF